MALPTPTTLTLSDNIIVAVEASIGKSIPLLPKSFTRVLAKALAGVFILVYKYAGFSLLQMFAAHASFRPTTVNGRTIVPLIEWGRLVGVGDPGIATNAQHSVKFDILNTDSSVVPAGTQLVYPSTGVIYITLTDVVLNLSPKTVAVLAASDPDGNGGSGIAGNRDTSDVLKWANPLPQLSTVGAKVLATLVQAADAETEDVYRDRVLSRFRARPQGGAYADYSVWGTEAAGILNIYPYTGGTPGTVDVFVEATVATSDADGRPDLAQRQAVEALIELDSSGLATRRPVNAKVIVSAITRQPFSVQVNGLAAADLAAAKTTITAALDDYLRSREPFITGLSKLPRNDRVTSLAIAGAVDEVADAVGATVTSVDLLLAGQPILTYTLDRGQKAKLEVNGVTFP